MKSGERWIAVWHSHRTIGHHLTPTRALGHSPRSTGQYERVVGHVRRRGGTAAVGFGPSAAPAQRRTICRGRLVIGRVSPPLRATRLRNRTGPRMSRDTVVNFRRRGDFRGFVRGGVG